MQMKITWSLRAVPRQKQKREPLTAVDQASVTEPGALPVGPLASSLASRCCVLLSTLCPKGTALTEHPEQKAFLCWATSVMLQPFCRGMLLVGSGTVVC